MQYKTIILRDKAGKAIKIVSALQKINEIRANDNTLNDSIEPYEILNLAINDIIWDWNLQTGEIVWSENYTRHFGWHLPIDKKSTEKEFFSRIFPEDHHKVTNSLQQYIQNPETAKWQLEYRFLKADGGFAYVNNQGYVVRDENGMPYRMLGVIKDDTESWYQKELLCLEKNALELFCNLNTSLVDILQTFLAGVEKITPQVFTSVLSVNKNGTIEYLTAERLPAAFKTAINGTKADPGDGCWGTAIYKKETSIISDVSSVSLSQNCKQIFENFGFQSCWSLPIIDNLGNVIGCLSFLYKETKMLGNIDPLIFERVGKIIQTIIQSNQSLQDIKNANERFEVIIKASNDLIWDWDLERGTIYRDEEGVHKIYGIKDETIINDIDEWIKRIHPSDRIKMQKIIKRILNAKDERAFELEYRFMREDGTYAYVSDRGILLLNNEGKPYRMIGAAHDITERKRLEKKLIDKELEKQRAINLATIDTQEQERTQIGKELHDNVNQVLTTTKLYLELAASNPEMKDQLIEKSTKNVIYVINEIRQLSRSLMNPSLGDLGLIDALRDLAENIHFTKKLHLNLELDEEVDSFLNENQKVMIFRISQEILNNTIKHAQATTVDIELSKVDNLVELIIRDDGRGFDILKVKKGAGLKNIQNRVYLTGGTLEVQSELGNGSTTIVKCPVKNHE